MVSVQRPPAVHCELLQDWLWPELDSSAAANNLHKNLHYLRSALAEHAAANAVALKAQQVVLAANVWIRHVWIRHSMRELGSGQLLEVISQEPAAHEGIPAWSRLTGNELVQVERGESCSRFYIRKKSSSS